MKKIAILASGEGTNAERIIRYFTGYATIEVAVVIASRPTAHVIERAHTLNVPCEVIIPQDFAAGKGLEVLKNYGIDFVVLAGFLSRIPDDVLHDYARRIVNIHPSLLPKFGGKGMYGMHVHEAVLAAGEHESGITIQYINEHYDEGDIIFQAKCPVLPGDTPETLAQRVHALEYTYYPQEIERLLSLLS
ncbi:phosphoribosylglycinamide formyltransferase [Phocaeicola sp.]|uniref:phosphoribosylglycinamide formyltransferase n=1 Tax=Phocaeicola sp. TaxID=2773926 RepID=UPI003076B2C9